MTKSANLNEKEIQNRVIQQLNEKGFPIIEYDVPIVIGSRKARLDIVLYRIQKSNKIPYCVIEIKAPYKILINSILQAESYANAIDAPFFAVLDGTKSTDKWFRTDRRKGESVIVDYEVLQKEISRLDDFTLVKIKNIRDFTKEIWSCLDLMRLEGMSPEKAFEEFTKIFTAKVIDEKEVLDETKSLHDFLTCNLSVKEYSKRIRKLLKNFPTYFSFLDSDQETKQVESKLEINLKDSLLFKIASRISRYELVESYEKIMKHGIKGMIVDNMFYQALSNLSGDFTTPRSIVKFMVDLIDPQNGDRILDPACGSGGFLIQSFNKIGGKHRFNEVDAHFSGIEIDQKIANYCRTNLILNGITSFNIINENSLLAKDFSLLDEKFDKIVTHPPFGFSTYDDSELDGRFSIRKTVRRKEALFLDLCINMLKPEGKLCILIPDDLLYKSNFKKLRTSILDRTKIKAIISIPKNSLRTTSGVRLSVLLLERKSSTRKENIHDEMKNSVFYAKIFEKDSISINENVFEENLYRILGVFKSFSIQGKIPEFWKLKEEEFFAFIIHKDQLSKLDRFDANLFYIESSQFSSLFDTKFIRFENLFEEIKAGRQFTKKDYKNQRGVLYLDHSNIENGRLKIQEKKYISEEKIKPERIISFKPDDYIIHIKGSHKSIGNFARIKKEFHGVISSSIVWLRPNKNEVTPDFLQALFTTNKWKNMLKSLLIETQYMSSLGIRDLKSIKIPFIPIKRQLEISNVYFHNLQTITYNQKLIKEINKRIGTNFLNEMDISLPKNIEFPNTTKEIRKKFEFDNTAFSKSAEYIKKLLSSISIEKKRLTDIAQFIEETIDPKMDLKKEYKIIETKSIESGYLPSYETVVGAKVKSNFNKIVREDDILISRFKNFYNKISIVPPELDGALVSQNIFVLRSIDQKFSNYLYFYFTTLFVLVQIRSKYQGTTIEQISKKYLGEILVLYPEVKTRSFLSNILQNERLVIQNLEEEIMDIEIRTSDRLEKSIWGVLHD